MRGKLYIPQYRHGTGGITPADAGKTITPFAVAKRAEDHPRGCGENGTRAAVNIPIALITPADAGKTEIVRP